MNWAVGQGLIAGMENGTLVPQGSATRAQVATILMRFVRTSCSKGVREIENEERAFALSSFFVE